MAHKLFIGGLAFSTSTDRLREVFAEAGAVESAAVVMDRDTGQSRGFAFVMMASADDAERARKQLDGTELKGRRLRVDEANDQSTPGARARRPGGRGTGGSPDRHRL